MAKITQVNNGDSGLVARTAFNEAMKTVESDATIGGTGTITDPLKVLSGGIPEAPNDGLQYGRQSEGWSEVTGAVDSVNGKTGVVVIDGTEVELIDGGGVTVTGAITDLDNTKVDEAPVDGSQYTRGDGSWNEVTPETVIVPAGDPLQFTIKADLMVGYQHGTVASPINGDTFGFDLTDQKVGASFIIVSSNTSAKPTYTAGNVVTIEEIGGTFIVGEQNVIRGENLGGGVWQIVYDNEGVEDPSAKLKDSALATYLMSSTDNGLTLVGTFLGAQAYEFPDGLPVGAQGTIINKTGDVITCQAAGGSSVTFESVGVLLETNFTALTWIHTGGNVIDLYGALT